MIEVMFGESEGGAMKMAKNYKKPDHHNGAWFGNKPNKEEFEKMFDGQAVGGNSSEVVCLPLMLDIGVDIDGDSSPVQSENEQERNVTIEITPPQGWQAMEGSVLPVHYMKNTASFMVKEEPFTSDTLDGVVDEALEIYGKTFSNLAVQGETETTTIDGKDAKKLTFTCTISKMNMKYLYVYLLVEGKTYVITFGDLADTFDSLSADYETILNNIQFKVQ